MTTELTLGTGGMILMCVLLLLSAMILLFFLFIFSLWLRGYNGEIDIELEEGKESEEK